MKPSKPELTYQNRAHWDDPAPSMDRKDLPSPPVRTVAEYERDRDLGIGTPVGKAHKPVVYGKGKGNVGE